MSKLGKSFNYLLALILVLSILLVKTPIVRAVCPLTIDPNQVTDAGTHSKITLRSNSCFGGTTANPQNYVVIAYPEELSLEDAIDTRAFAIRRDNRLGSSTFGAPAEYVKSTDSNSLSTTLDFGYETYGWTALGFGKKLLRDKYNNRPYKVRVCVIYNLVGGTGDNASVLRKQLKKCTDDALVGETQPGSLWVGENPSGTVPDDLPIIDKDEKSQTTCVFQINKPIIINKINKIIQDDQVEYGWWRYHEEGNIREFQPGEFQVDPATNQATATINDTSVFKLGMHRICIDLTKKGTKRAADVRYENCLGIKIIASPVDPSNTIACSQIADLVTAGCTGPGCASAAGVKQTGCTDVKNNPGIATAIGCIRTNPVELTKSFLKFALGISGGLAFLLMIFGAFQMLTSAGNPETLNAGKDRLTSAVIGLLLIIFSVLLLQIIGVDILGLGQQFGLK